MLKRFPFIITIIIMLTALFCEKKTEAVAQDCGKCPSASTCGKAETEEETCATEREILNTKASKITFLELGSSSCIPCKKMEPILESVEKRYGEQIDVIFHDVKKDRDIAKQYNIRLIPTQIFLDENGNELFRHEGFFPESNIDEFLQSKDLKPVQ
ncbi:thioredoxin family protein [bacterium]|nr:thioredoxin family protein [bacterium]MBU1633150.1 thioredoxin family protein [bacterium]MBU1872330.1 thioredoxin family protein [bacterium]